MEEIVINTIRILVLLLSIYLGVKAGIGTVTGSDMQSVSDYVKEIVVNLLFMAMIMGAMMWTIYLFEKIGEKWAYDMAGVLGMLVGSSMWYFYMLWRREYWGLE